MRTCPLPGARSTTEGRACIRGDGGISGIHIENLELRIDFVPVMSFLYKLVVSTYVVHLIYQMNGMCNIFEILILSFKVDEVIDIVKGKRNCKIKVQVGIGWPVGRRVFGGSRSNSCSRVVRVS